MKQDISGLMDGELDPDAATAVIARLKHEEDLKNAWADYHLIGDALRQDATLFLGFSERLSEKLGHEPAILAPRRTLAQKVKFTALSVAASLAAVAMVGWVVLQNYTDKPKENLAATQPTSAQAMLASLPRYPFNSNVNEYLLAHQEFSPSTTMQGVVSYARTVSGEGREASR
ncbi:MAG TPA: sigma-E factor negative regulatory protein [Burkholderiales bacterium]|nr:sigma-E factor negative regulatory protein [Burkholderiales bacterium]